MNDMKRPHEMRLGWKKYSIIFRRFERRYGDAEEKQDDFGNHVDGNYQIILNTAWPDPQLGCTLLHEVIHAIDIHAAMGLTEEQVHGLANMLTDVLRGNPEVAAYIVARRGDPA